MKSWRPRSNEFSAVDRLGLWVSIALATAVFLTLFASMARAEDHESPDARPPLPDLVVQPCPEAGGLHVGVEYEGQQGVWFPRPTAECLLGRLVTLGRAVPYIRLLEDRLSLDDERNALQERQVELAEQQSDAASNALRAAVRRAREAEESRDAWYRHPALWAGIGAVVVVALEVVAVIVFERISP